MFDAADRGTLVFIDAQPNEYSVYGWKNVDCVIWQAAPSAAGVERLRGLIERRANQTSCKMSSVHCLTSGARLPDAAARNEFEVLRAQCGQYLACFAIVLEPHGLLASALRALVTGLVLLGPERYTLHVSGSIDEVADWLPRPHLRETGVELNAKVLRTMLHLARRRVHIDPLAPSPSLP